jgi:ribA/ribD-fused uncharacterized protein
MTPTSHQSVAEPTSVQELLARMAGGWDPEFLFFWGHTRKGRQTYVGRECLSQWYPAPFVIDGVTFPTAEHMMMYRKARLFGDDAAAAQILAARHPGEAKTLGRKVSRFDEAVWRRERFEIVVAASVAKFSQNLPLKAFLVSTKQRVLVEASPRDQIWGIGMAESNPSSRAPEAWRGLNLLGFALMRARRTLVTGAVPA